MSTAAWALMGVIVGGLISGVINFILQREKLKHETKIQDDKFAHEKEMFIMQNQSAEMVKALLNEMLSHKSYTDRKFTSLRKPIGGFSDDEVRQLLHELNSKKVERDGEEWWYLLSRQEERIENLKIKKAKAK